MKKSSGGSFQNLQGKKHEEEEEEEEETSSSNELFVFLSTHTALTKSALFDCDWGDNLFF